MSNITLYKHQQTTVEFMRRTPRAAIWLEMGLGKSLCAIEATKDLARVLVICPNYLKHTWANEYKKWTPLRPLVVEAEKRSAQLRSDVWPRIINYEGARIDAETIACLKPEAIIIDESQYVKERSSKVTKALWAIVKYNPTARVYVMTGTPVCNGFQDYYAQYKMILPSMFPTWTEFKNRYLIFGGYGGYKVVGTRNEDTFHRLTDPYTIRLKKADALDLPEKIYQQVIVEMPAELRAKYNQMAREAAIEIDQATVVTADMVTVRLMRLQQLCSGWIGEVLENGERRIHDVAPNPKMDALLNIIRDANQQVVVWAHFRKDIADICSTLCAHGIGAMPINGAVDPKDRQERIDRFQAGKLRVLVIQDSIVAGMTLTAASLVIYYQNSYSYANRIQSEDRCHRIGQRNAVTYIDLVVARSIEEQIIKAIAKKENLAACVDKNTLREAFLEGIK